MQRSAAVSHTGQISWAAFIGDHGNKSFNSCKNSKKNKKTTNTHNFCEVQWGIISGVICKRSSESFAPMASYVTTREKAVKKNGKSM